ncbi:MAG TPA: NTP transferase domain-containing protein [Propionibacteriaceae bacterium]|nr:NTP transferase domain-containing protein [Propionibacteriaceae bacterium]
MRRVTAVVLAGGASQRFAPDKLAERVDGESLLDRALMSLPEQVTTVIVVGAVREVARPVIFTAEEPAGGGPAAALVAGLRRALEQSGDAIVTLPGDAPLAGQAAKILLSRLESEPSIEAVVGTDVAGREQPLQLALRPAGARALVAAAGPRGAAGVSARRLLDALRPGLVPQKLAPAELWDIDTHDQLLVWRLQSSAAVSSILDLAAERQKGVDRPVVIAIDGPSCSGKSILATAVALRSGASVLEGDDFYRDTLPSLSTAQREAMSDAAVVDAVIDWVRLRDQALVPLRAGEAATFQPYDWDANDGRLAPPRIIPAAEVIIVEGVYAARPELAELIDLTVYLGIDPGLRADRYAEREADDPDWQRFWERGERYYFSVVRPPASFDIQLDDQDLGVDQPSAQ